MEEGDGEASHHDGWDDSDAAEQQHQTHCRREPAEPRRRSAQTRVSRPASTTPSSSSTLRLASTSATPAPG